MRNRSCVWLIALLCTISAATHGQVLKVEGGVAFSKLKPQGLKDVQLFDKSVAPFHMSVGLEYLDREHFNLSSSIGYLRTGGKDEIIVNAVTGEGSTFDYKYFIDYITVNTLFHIKSTIRRETYYIGVGPRLDFKIGSKETELGGKEVINSENPKMNAVVFGLKCEAGFWYALTDRMRLGINVSYLPSFTNAWTSPAVSDVGMRSRTFTLGAVLGYVL